MRPITKYRADDGSEWDTADCARRRDSLHAAVTAALAGLGTWPALGSKAYVQHRAATVRAARAMFAAVARAFEPTMLAEIPDDWHPDFGPWGRILSDGDGPLARAYMRFACIDDAGREWQQPYFTSHTPSDAACVEDRSA
jgi:hypothetical protein